MIDRHEVNAVVPLVMPWNRIGKANQNEDNPTGLKIAQR